MKHPDHRGECLPVRAMLASALVLLSSLAWGAEGGQGPAGPALPTGPSAAAADTPSNGKGPPVDLGLPDRDAAPAEPPGQGMVMEKVPAQVVERLSAGVPQEVIVLFDDSAIQEEAAVLRARGGARSDIPDILALKAQRYQALKRQALETMPPAGHEMLHDYGHLPMAFIRIRSPVALWALLGRPEVKAVYENSQFYPQLDQSRSLIGPPSVAAAGRRSNGTSVVVLDSSVDYTHSAFGICPYPGAPGCRVIGTGEIAPEDYSQDTGHGTNVAGTMLRVASGTAIVAFDVFYSWDGVNQNAQDVHVIQGINWAIANKATYNIAAINMSLSGGGFPNPCSSSTNPYVIPIAKAWAAGILPVIAADNNSYKSAISRPACTPGAVSVGPAYDNTLG